MERMPSFISTSVFNIFLYSSILQTNTRNNVAISVKAKITSSFLLRVSLKTFLPCIALSNS